MNNKSKYYIAASALMAVSIATAAPTASTKPVVAGSILSRVQAFLDKPATWDKIPKNVTLIKLAL